MDTIDKINYFLVKQGKTGADLSRALGLSNSVYSQWNTKKNKPAKAKIAAIAEYLGVSVDDLIADGDNLQSSVFFEHYEELCNSRGKSPNGVAKELGFPSSSVTQWKHGSVPRPAALQVIAGYFGVTVEYLISGADNKKAAPEVGDGDLDTSGLSADAIDFAKRVAALSPEKRALLDAYIRALKDI